ncbi:50S ribosome-binding GTPase [Patescibacteria group bacterium]|nr:GTP-binding protein [Candidatus Falkowbacteria bacterium]MBU3906406.1 50S ribosome-binding GTPase [Patescibacteria group bacterium]MCG2698466.1 50S ribosome-binding GTPase [Candidatus Parcubacteria bacterium]MBU4014887.1 50S ribosome-binding GTPase [Patescibacteria group bacterium]MBU4026836.1 50S ribosome-binding GTPase [Patescibacteria group bacterium]
MAKRKEYSIISFAGRINAGKSSLLNLLSGQKDFAIVDAQPGTTADTVIARMEIHGLGSIKVLDTAGIDEYSKLGEKKRKKTYEAVEESDLTFIVIDLLKNKDNKDFAIEKEVIKRALKHKSQVLIIYNIFSSKEPIEKITELENLANQKLGMGLPSFCLNALNGNKQKELVNFISTYFKKENQNIDLIPLKSGKGYVLLNIPMDEETPALRLLRPQDMAAEKLLRKYLIPVLFRMDLKKARSDNQAEKERFLNLVKHLRNSKEGLKLIITDSQAMDIVGKWTPQNIPLTTFSVMMANYMSGGNLNLFVKGLEAFSSLQDNDKILIMEICNHNRKCDDIGTKQIPRLIKEKLGLKLKIDFSFGRALPENLSKYKLALHCGGCMADRQKYGRRIVKLKEAGVPVTNYGLFLSWIHNPKAVKRVTKIFQR